MVLISINDVQKTEPQLAYTLYLQVDGDTVAVKKQEEIVTKRKVEETTTKQIETRVKRHVTLEDGHIVADSGPLVTTNTTQDTQTKEEEKKEHLKAGDDTPLGEGWVAIPGAVVVREKKEKKTKTRDEIEEKLETEEAHHLGDLTNDDIVRAIREKSDVRLALTRRRDSDSSSAHKRQDVVALPNKKIVHQSRKHKRYVDQEDTQEKSEEKDGRIVTETTRHEHHEEFDDEEVPDDEPVSEPSVHEITKETKKNYTHVKDDDQVDYVLVPPDGKLSQGVKLGQGLHLTSETIEHDRQGASQLETADKEWESLSARIRKNREAIAGRSKNKETPPAQRATSPERKDALTKEPLDLEAEEETRKLETSRWLESHFGSESSRSSHNDNDHQWENDFESKPTMPSQVSSGGISVTMMSSSPKFQTREAFDEVDHYAAPPPPPPPPLPTAGPQVRPKTFSPGPVNDTKAGSSTSGTGKVISSGRYAGYSDRVQVLPVGPGKTFFNKSTSSPPQSPIYKTAGLLNGSSKNINNSPNEEQNSSKLSKPESEIYSAPVKRSTSFHAAPKPFVPAWRKNEDAEEISENSFSQTRESLKTKTSLPRTTSMKDEYRRPFIETKEDKPVLKNARQWPPPKPEDDDEDADKSWKYQPKATVIRLGPQNEEVDETYQPKKTFTTGNVSRSKSMLLPSNPYRSEERVQMQNQINRERYAMKSSSQLNLSRASPPRRSSPEDLIPERETPFIRSPALYESRPSPKSPPPPRPAPPSVLSQRNEGPRSTPSYSNRLEKSQIYEDSKKIYASPTFADQINGPPVRPERRKSKLRPKTDSGTQTFRHEMTTQTLDRPKPKKKFYLGEDPFTGDVSAASKKPELTSYATLANPKTEARRTERYQRETEVKSATRNEKLHSQTLPRKTSDNETPRKFFFGEYNGKEKESPNVSVRDRSLNETYGGSMINVSQTSVRNQKTATKTENLSESLSNPPQSSAAVGRSQSFNVRTVSSPKTLFTPKPLNSIQKESKFNSPLYKSSPFLNKNVVDSSAPLKSPGIVTTISRSQLDLMRSISDEKEDREPLVYNSSLFTLPRKKTERLANREPVESSPATNLFRSQSAVHRSAADRVVNNHNQSVSNGNRQSLSSLHYAKTSPKNIPQQTSNNKPEDEAYSSMTFQSSSKATHRSFLSDSPADRSRQPYKSPEEPSTLPRVVSGKTKGPAPPPPPKTYAQPRSAEKTSPENDGKRQQFLQGLLNTAPELFLHIHGDEDLSSTRIDRQDVIDGKPNAKYLRPTPPDSPPPLTRPGATPREPLYTPVNKGPRTNLNRIYTSTPVLNRLSSSPERSTSTSRYNSSFRTIQEEHTPPSLSRAGNSTSLVRAESTPRRGSLTPSGSMVIRPMKIPAPENYSETVRIKSSGEPDPNSRTETDSVQTFSKRIVPMKDGFCSETVESSEKTTVTKSQFQEHGTPHSRHYNGQYNVDIRPQQTGGVIIHLGDRKGSR